MPAATTLAIVGAIATGVGAVGQYMAGQDAKKASQNQAAAQREQAGLEQRRADIANARQLRTQVRQARIARASILNTGANVGTTGSSGVLGGAASVSSQNAANMSFHGQMQGINAGVMQTQVAQADAAADMGAAQGSSATWGAFGKLGGTVFDAGGGFKTIFS